MIGEVERVEEYHVDARRLPLGTAQRERNRVGERRIGDLFDRLVAECKRCLEFRHELGLWPRCLDRVGRRRVPGVDRRLHRAEVAAEEVTVARDVLCDEAEGQLRGRWLVAELRLRN